MNPPAVWRDAKPPDPQRMPAAPRQLAPLPPVPSPALSPAHARLANSNSRQTISIAVDPAIVQLLGNRLVVIGLLAIAGPVGLPALWISWRFSKTTKIATTILFLTATILGPLLFTYYWTELALRPLVDVFQQRK